MSELCNFNFSLYHVIWHSNCLVVICVRVICRIVLLICLTDVFICRYLMGKITVRMVGLLFNLECVEIKDFIQLIAVFFFIFHSLSGLIKNSHNITVAVSGKCFLLSFLDDSVVMIFRSITSAVFTDKVSFRKQPLLDAVDSPLQFIRNGNFAVFIAFPCIRTLFSDVFGVRQQPSVVFSFCWVGKQWVAHVAKIEFCSGCRNNFSRLCVGLDNLNDVGFLFIPHIVVISVIVLICHRIWLIVLLNINLTAFLHKGFIVCRNFRQRIFPVRNIIDI